VPFPTLKYMGTLEKNAPLFGFKALCLLKYQIPSQPKIKMFEIPIFFIRSTGRVMIADFRNIYFVGMPMEIVHAR